MTPLSITVNATLVSIEDPVRMEWKGIIAIAHLVSGLRAIRAVNKLKIYTKKITS